MAVYGQSDLCLVCKVDLKKKKKTSCHSNSSTWLMKNTCLSEDQSACMTRDVEQSPTELHSDQLATDLDSIFLLGDKHWSKALPTEDTASQWTRPTRLEEGNLNFFVKGMMDNMCLLRKYTTMHASLWQWLKTAARCFYL